VSKRHAPSAERNRAPLLPLLQEVLPARGTVLEVASGTGQHAVFFSRALPSLTWQPTDVDPASLESIEAWRQEEGPPNLLAPLPLDVTRTPWPLERADALVCINMIHISPWEACQGLLRGAARVLSPGAPLVLYGAYFIEGQPPAPSNLAFDASLRERDPSWGVRELGAVLAEAASHGLVHERIIDMPNHNLTVVLRRPQVLHK
jgi:ubiquinone/menaquinone biosynthesis C-methylase UbiE